MDLGGWNAPDAPVPARWRNEMRATTRDDIKGWLDRAKQKGATHMIVACDTFDWEDYPVFVMPGEDVHKIAAQHDGPNMTRLMEVYNLSMDINEQLTAGRTRNF